MRNTFCFLFFLLVMSSYGQNKKVVDWINENAIEIKDVDPNSELKIFESKAPSKFTEAKIFGFGESSHHSSEFFTLKAKFFKYLVKNHDVKTFIMEESFPAEENINKWISGGEGSIETIANNFSMGIWYSKEVVNLLFWMREYNLGKDEKDQIRFYGMDIQNARTIDQKIIDIAKKYQITLDERSISTLKECSSKQVVYQKASDWADMRIPYLENIEKSLKNSKKNDLSSRDKEIDIALRALHQLMGFTQYVQKPYSQERDLQMFHNVEYIVQNNSRNGKAFIWAHNEHVNNRGFGNYSARKIYNLGRYLKEKYKNEYYSVGFDFSTGKVKGLQIENGKAKWQLKVIEKPISKTYSETFHEVYYPIFFLDIENALESKVGSYFSKKNKQLVQGDRGYVSNKTNLMTKKLSEMFDAIIFVREISLSDTNLTDF